jgi:hypothetical protein
MDDTVLLVGLVIALVVGGAATAILLRRPTEVPAPDSPFAASTEGEKRCPKCGMGNLWTDRNCITCNARLPG